MKAKDRLVIALDVSSLREVAEFVMPLQVYTGYFKVGLQLITAVGTPKSVNFIKQFEEDVVLDGKFNDIPRTMGKATKEAAKLGVKMLTVHASAGIDSMRAAVENKGKSKVFAVSVLTSFSDVNPDVACRPKHVFGARSKKKVLQFARDAKSAGCDGIVCSGWELGLLAKHKELRSLLTLVVGIRSKDDPPDDQSRTMTVEQAIIAGADYIVVGRSILEASEADGGPVGVARRIVKEIREASKRRKENVRRSRLKRT